LPPPELHARETIDRLLTAAGWHVCDADKANIHVARGVAIREFPLPGHGFADYLLYVGGKAAGVAEIVREEFGKGNDFAQKITYRTTGAKPKDLINEFRTSPMPRIAVTVGEAETSEHPVNDRPAERARHGWRALGFRAERDARAKKVIATGTAPTSSRSKSLCSCVPSNPAPPSSR
jgi:hypothetical protein